MAKVSLNDMHDWLTLKVSFADGSKANITWSRGGETVTVTPSDPARNEQLSLIVAEAKSRSAKPDYACNTPGKQANELANAARAAVTLDDYLANSRKALQVTGERPKPRNTLPAPETATVSARKGRGWEISAVFPTGERIQLTINGRSARMIMDPPITSRQDQILKAILGAKMIGTLDDDAIVDLIKDTVPGSPDIETWQDEFMAALSLAPRMKP